MKVGGNTNDFYNTYQDFYDQNSYYNNDIFNEVYSENHIRRLNRF